MKIGLLDIDYGRSKSKMAYPNLALCKIAAYHKHCGDDVEWATPFEHYDILYRSKVFNFSEDDLRVYNCDKEIRGGTGYNITDALPPIIDSMQPDYSIYPNVPKDTAYGFLTRGCPNKCQWCVVPRKEGNISPYWDIERVSNGRKKVVLMDNNILAAGDYAKEQLRKIIDMGLRVDFNQALDARLVTDEFAQLLAKVKWLHSRIRFGCDTHAQIDECERAMDLISKHGFRGEYFLYTILTDDMEECVYRAGYWWEINQRYKDGFYHNAVYIHAQPYRNPKVVNEIPQWQKDFARWANKRELYSTVWLDDYEPRKGVMFYKYTHTYHIIK